MTRKTQALALRIWPHSNTSQIISWLTPDKGRISTLAKGALRPRSHFLGQCDLFYTCELVYYARSKTDLYIAKEMAALTPRSAFRADWRASCAASYWSSLLQHISVEQNQHDELFSMALLTLDALTTGTNLERTLLWGELKVLHYLGLTPELNQCAICHRPSTQDTVKSFSIQHGGILCPSCSKTCTVKPQRLGPRQLTFLCEVRAAKHPLDLRLPTMESKQLLELQRIIGLFLEFHIETSSFNRNIALSTFAK